jgi:hypothetical protein
MRYKDEEIKRQWETGLLHPKLRDQIVMLDSLAQICGMEGGLMLTSIYRPESMNSYHSLWRAVDIRDRDWDAAFDRLFMTILISIKRWDKEAQWEKEPSDAHPNSPPHYHIEADDGSLQKSLDKNKTKP